ncbi:MAG: hypothetical protein GY842_13150, partial [bacterium]|nr:hypothetical protein [bacterium]
RGGFLTCFAGPHVTPPDFCLREGAQLFAHRAAADPPPSGTFALHGRPMDVLSDGHVLVYIRARFYDPKHARWLQRDPTGYTDGNALYEAFANNATANTDPMGTIIEELSNLYTVGKYASYEELLYATAHHIPFAAVQSGELRALCDAGGALIDLQSYKLLPQGFEEGYRQPAIEAATGRFDALINAQVTAGASREEVSSNLTLTAFFVSDLSGITQLGEGVFGVDLATNRSLGTGESARRIVQGGSTLVIIVGGPKAIRSARARSTALGAAGPEAALVAEASATGAVRTRVLANITRSQHARAASNFEVHVARESQLTGLSTGEVRTFSAVKPGPLPDNVAETFAGGRYFERVLRSERVYHRVAGGTAGPIGRRGTFVTPIPQIGGLQSRIDLAIRPEWGNSAVQVYRLRVPAGTTVFEGPVSTQGGPWVGGKIQAFIPDAAETWIVP